MKLARIKKHTFWFANKKACFQAWCLQQFRCNIKKWKWIFFSPKKSKVHLQFYCWVFPTPLPIYLLEVLVAISDIEKSDETNWLLAKPAQPRVWKSRLHHHQLIFRWRSQLPTLYFYFRYYYYCHFRFPLLHHWHYWS